MPIVHLRSLRVRYTVTGRGPGLLLLHGPGGSGAVWSEILESVSVHYRALAPDLPGHGETDPLPAEAWAALESFPGAFLDALGIDRASVVAHGETALAALAWSLREPARVRDLVLVAPLGRRPPSRSRRKQLRGARGAPLRRLALSPFGGRRALRGIVAKPEALTTPAADTALDALRAHMDLRPLLREMPLLASLPLVPHLVPRTQIVWGERDPVADPRDLAAWLSTVPRAEGATIPAAGHMPMLEEPAALAAALLAFLGSPGTPDALGSRPSVSAATPGDGA